RGGRYLARYDLKVAKGIQAFDGENAWELTPTGEVVTQTAPEQAEAARTEAWITARGYWFPERWAAEVSYDRLERDGERSWHVLRATPEGGRELELWLDADSGLLARRVERGGTGTTTTVYED